MIEGREESGITNRHFFSFHSHPGATADQRYVIAPYSSYQGLLPFGRTQVAGLGPQGYLNSEYLVYPSMTDVATGRQGILTNLIGAIQQQFQNLQLPSFLRPRPEKPDSPEVSEGPEAPERPSEGNAPLPPFSEGVSGQNPAPEETEDLDTVIPDENPAAPASNAESEENPVKPEGTPAKPEETPDKPEENPTKPEEVPEEKPESPMEEVNAEMASESRLFARSRAYPGREGEGD
ncbi:hypothetical protein J437_LFUL012241 [Ladona fulva]|uniref:Uncharacterized protein n=1 Tax=Ladona fulva TaxID=123851 RepID=A0A8K0KDH0_LADFU|nr:hypothetical protein J437_LFUL012241 [Ladona fulva]